jgi:hypothetical protein
VVFDSFFHRCFSHWKSPRDDADLQVVNALCQHRFGEGVHVDEVIAGQEAAKGPTAPMSFLFFDDVWMTL